MNFQYAWSCAHRYLEQQHTHRFGGCFSWYPPFSLRSFPHYSPRRRHTCRTHPSNRRQQRRAAAFRRFASKVRRPMLAASSDATLLSDFLTGNSLADLASRYRLSTTAAENLIRTAILRHDSSATTAMSRRPTFEADAEREALKSTSDRFDPSRALTLPEYRRLKALAFLAEELHFGRAARRMNMQQSPLSRLIIGLERDLGFELFSRTKRFVRLTVAGKCFLEHSKQILDALDGGIREARCKTG